AVVCSALWRGPYRVSGFHDRDGYQQDHTATIRSMWVVVAVVALVAAVATYLTWIATRVDRLHARVAAARTALLASSRRRADAAAEFGEREGFTEAQTAAAAVLAASAEERAEAE